jgi:hypothetical protein
MRGPYDAKWRDIGRHGRTFAAVLPRASVLCATCRDETYCARGRRMTEEGSKQTGEDHEVWLKCFVATLSDATKTVSPESGVGPEDVASICAAIADAAVKEERRRRPEVKWPR